MKSVKLNILQSSCAPLLFIMRLTGIPLDDDYTNSSNHSTDTKTRSLFTNFYSFIAKSVSFFMFFVNMESNLMFIVLVFIYLFDTKNKFDDANFTTTFFWNEVIEAFNLVFITFGTHLTLLASTLVHWPELVRYLHRLELEFHLTPRLYYKRFRYISIAAFLYWMLVPLSVAILVIQPILSGPMVGSWIKLVFTLNNVLFIYPNSAGVLFLSLAWMVSKCLQILAKRIENKANYQVKVGRRITLLPNEKNYDERMLDEWKRMYLLLDHLVDELNRSFGLPLLIIFSAIIVRLINNLFKVILSFNVEELDGNHFRRIHFLLIDFFGIFLAAYVSHLIKEEASNVTNQLRRIHFDDHFLHTKINFLVMEISHSPLQITACGLFPIDLRIVLSLIGSAITYLIILWQFQISEKARS